MSLNTNQRRDQRRRLVVSWKRSAGTALAAASRTNANAAPTQPLLRDPQCGAERCNDKYDADNRAG